MNAFITVEGKINRVFNHVQEGKDGDVKEYIGVEVSYGANRDTVFTPVSLFETRFGFRVDQLAKQALIGGLVMFAKSAIREGEEFVYFEGAEEVHVAELDLTINNVKAVTINPAFVAVLPMLTPAVAPERTVRRVAQREETGDFNPTNDAAEFGSTTEPTKGVKNTAKTTVPAE